jgi:hypothetical protein
VGVITPDIKQPGHEVDHLPLSSAEVENAFSYIPLPQYIFMVWCLNEQWVYLQGVILSSAQGQLYLLLLTFILYK